MQLETQEFRAEAKFQRVSPQKARLVLELIKGRKVSAYPACQVEVELAGAEYMGIAVDQAVTDGNLVTAPAWPAHPAWIAQFLALLGTKITL